MCDLILAPLPFASRAKFFFLNKIEYCKKKKTFSHQHRQLFWGHYFLSQHAMEGTSNVAICINIFEDQYQRVNGDKQFASSSSCIIWIQSVKPMQSSIKST